MGKKEKDFSLDTLCADVGELASTHRAINNSVRAALDAIDKQRKNLESANKQFKSANEQLKSANEQMEAFNAAFPALVQDATLIRNEFFSIGKPYRWPEFANANVKAEVPDEPASVTDVNYFIKRTKEITDDANPRRVVDALVSLALDLAKSVNTLKSRIAKMKKRTANESGCTDAEKKEAKLFIRSANEKVEIQTKKLDMVRTAHDEACRSLVRFGTAQFNKFYEVLAANDVRMDKPQKGVAA